MRAQAGLRAMRLDMSARLKRLRVWLFEGATRESIREGIAGLCFLALVVMVIIAAFLNGEG